MAHITTEAEIEDAKRDQYYEKNVRECGECGGELVCTQRFAETRVDPACELWECACGNEEEG